MNPVPWLLRLLGSMVLAFLLAVTAFGAVLAPLWNLTGGVIAWQWLALAAATAAAFCLGGFFLRRLVGTRNPAYTAVFGFVAAVVSFGYVLGADPKLIGFTLAGTWLAAIGGLIPVHFDRQPARRPPPD